MPRNEGGSAGTSRPPHSERSRRRSDTRPRLDFSAFGPSLAFSTSLARLALPFSRTLLAGCFACWPSVTAVVMHELLLGP